MSTPRAPRVRRASVAFILVTLFIDSLGFGLVIPIVPKLVEQLLGGAISQASFAVGLLTALYAVMQFFAAPVLGALSDRYGRRPVILLALTALGCDYVLLSLAPNLWWLAAGRAIAGIGGATYTPAGAYIADVSPPEKRAANFGLIGVAFGLGFIAGPALGGLLGAGSLRLPFVAAALLSFANFLFGVFVLPESLAPENRRPVVPAQANPLGALRAVWRYAGVAALLPVAAVSGVAQMGLQSVWVLYTTYRYAWSVADVGISLAIVGLLFAVVQGALVRPVVARFGEGRTLVGGLVVASACFFLFGLATEGWMMYAITAGYCLGLGLVGPAMQGLTSRAVPADEQGLLQGAFASVNTAAIIVGPLLAAGLFGYFVGPAAPVVLPGAPFFMGGALFLLSLALALRATAASPASPASPAATGPSGVVPPEGAPAVASV
jgi:MFS transporter, DHA1 family, tetracycline resistance protein